MERIGNIKLSELAQPSSGNGTLIPASQKLLPNAELEQVESLMRQVKARYPNQEMGEGTPEMILALWERMALRYGMRVFKAGLFRAIETSRFFPDAVEIAERCGDIASTARGTDEARMHIRMMDEAKERWARERETA